MTSAQLSGRASLRDLVSNLSAQSSKHYHLGLKPTNRSTLARVNDKKPHTLYEALFGRLLGRCKSVSPRHRFKNKLYSLDASIIDLCLSVFPWATFRKAKGAVKLHFFFTDSLMAEMTIRTITTPNIRAIALNI
jgi:putative transposase